MIAGHVCELSLAMFHIGDLIPEMFSSAFIPGMLIMSDHRWECFVSDCLECL